jgi:hypothetical protein
MTRGVARQAYVFTSWSQVLRLLTVVSCVGGLMIHVASRFLQQLHANLQTLMVLENSSPFYELPATSCYYQRAC